MIPPEISALLDIISLIISAIGILIIIYGVSNATYRIVRTEFFHEKRFKQYEHTKRILIQKIILALDFFVAADLIRLMVAVTMDELLSIALIVAIRTVLSWSLSREVELHEE